MKSPFRKTSDLCLHQLGGAKSTKNNRRRKKQLTAPQGLLKFLNFHAFFWWQKLFVCENRAQEIAQENTNCLAQCTCSLGRALSYLSGALY